MIRHTAGTITDPELDALYAELDTLRTELGDRTEQARERWIQQLLDDCRIRALDFRNGAHMDLEPAREIVAAWVAAARTILGDATNYTETPVEMEVGVAESPERFVFILQRAGKLTPHQARLQAEQRARHAETRLAHIRETAQLHRLKLMTTNELYATIEADDDPPAVAP
jgi:hypothetical protein